MGKKLTDQVQIDIRELRSKWILPRVERVTTNTLKLYQVREQLKLSKVLYLDEERILEEFNKVKQGLKTSSTDDDTFEATRETCMFLGGKLMDIRNKQLRCYNDNEDMETEINKEIMTLRFEDKDFADLDINQVRASTPLRQLSPTPLDRHRSREPSPFTMPKLRLGSGTITPGGSKSSDPHTYLSRPGSSQSLYGGTGGIGGSHMDLDTFRAAMEAKQAEDESLPKDNRQSISHNPTISQSMCDINLKVESSSFPKSDGSDFLAPGSMFCAERPSSAMSDMSINMHDGEYMSRAESRMEHFGDDVSQDIIPFGHGQEFADKAIADKVLKSKPLPGNQTYQQESSTNIQKLYADNEAHQKVIQTTKIQAAVNEKTEKKDSGQIQYESKFIEQSNIESKQAIDQQQQKEIIKDKEVKSSKSGQKIKPNIEKKNLFLIPNQL